MTNAENEILSLMESVRQKYFSELTDLAFEIEKKLDVGGVAMRVIIGSPIRICLYYDDDRVLTPRYRFGLIPIISHECAHLVNPVDPEQILVERLPKAMVELWLELREAGLAVCSMNSKHKHTIKREQIV